MTQNRRLELVRAISFCIGLTAGFATLAVMFGALGNTWQSGIIAVVLGIVTAAALLTAYTAYP